MGDGILVAHDVCGLAETGDGQYLASFPTIGHVRVEVSDTLDELVSLILAVYHRHEKMSAPFSEAVREVVLKTPDWSGPPLATKV